MSRNTGIIVTAIIAFACCTLTSCKNEGKKKFFLPSGDAAVVNDSGGNVGSGDGEVTQGISSNDNITVVNGKILVTVDNGVINIAGENLTLTTQVDGIWTLVPGVTITLKDNDGNTITGSIVVDPVTGNISFVPSSSLNVNEYYTIHVNVGGNDYTASLVIAVDNTSQEDSLFADVPVYSASGTYPVQSCIVNGKAIFGWQFPPNFKITMIDVESGAQPYLTFYGVYDIAQYSDLVFYQRWAEGTANAGDPVKNYKWTWDSWNWMWTWIHVDDQDASLDGDADYSFKRTYAEIRIINSAGKDITATSAAKFKVITE